MCVSRTLSGRRAAPPARLQKLGVQKYSTKMWLPIATAVVLYDRCKTFCREMAMAAPAPRPPKVAIQILTGPDVRGRYRYNACFYVHYDMQKFI